MKRASVLVAALAAGALGAAGAAAAAGQGGTAGGGSAYGTPQPGATWGKRYTTGWDQMSKAERHELGTRLRAVKTYEECRAVVEQSRQQMVERARAKGQPEPATPRRDGCASFPH